MQSKKRFEKEWKEAEKANQQTEKVQQDPNATKPDVDKVRHAPSTHLIMLHASWVTDAVCTCVYVLGQTARSLPRALSGRV